MSELAFNITQMSGALSILLLDDIYHEDMIEQIELFDSYIHYELIEYGQKSKFETLLRRGYPSLLIDLSKVTEAKSFLDILLQLRDKFDDEHRLILLSNTAIYNMVENNFEQLKGYGMDVFTLISKDDERIAIIKSFEEKYQMNSEVFLERWKDGQLEDTEEYNRWYVLL